MRLLPWDSPRVACTLVLVGTMSLGLPASRLHAQTYTPRQIRFDGGGDPAELLRLTGLTPGSPLTKAQIDAAMSKLADTGAFTDLSYTVGADALVIKLSGGADSPGQGLQVRYVNLVWWQPDELTRLLEARVPLFHGALPLNGSLTDHVCAALVQLLAEKGISNAKVEAMPSTLHAAGGSARTGVDAMALTVTRPEIVLGKVTLPGAAPETQAQLDLVTDKLAMQEFETDVTAEAIRNNAADTEKNAGFLQATVDPPVFSPPRADMNGYAIDASADVHPGVLYRISSLDLGARPPLTEPDAAKIVGLKPGMPAGAMALKISVSALQREYIAHGFLDAEVKLQSTLDHANHTVAMRYSIDPGQLYHLASVDTSALPPDLGAAFTREFTGRPGMDAGLPMSTEIARALAALSATHRVKVGLRLQRAGHTVVVVLVPARTETQPHPPGA